MISMAFLLLHLYFPCPFDYNTDNVKTTKKIRLAVGIVFFAVYFFYAARPIPLETVLIPRWLNSVESGTLISLEGSRFQTDNDESDANMDVLLPYQLGNRFGYINRDGRFAVNREKKANVSLSREYWAEYEAEPDRITVQNSNGAANTAIENPSGYPFFLDGKMFLISSEQNAVSAVDESGAVTWTYEFAAPLTCVDSAAGLVLVGSLDGIIGVLDSNGKQVFSFEPGGSQYPIILGCALSRDASHLAIISGIGNQRLLILEHFGSNAVDYKVAYHEFVGEGFRRPVYISFIENDRWVAFERNDGLGFYEINARQTNTVVLDGQVSAIDLSGGQGMVFSVISGEGNKKKLIGIRLPDRVMIDSPFRSAEVFMSRIDSRLIVGGGQSLIAFDLEKR